jgi:hypothetical protein
MKETLEEVQLAILFHNTYENLAPNFGYETRADTKSFETTTPNGMLMIAVCKEIIKWQAERMYSEEDLKEAYFSAIKITGEGWNGEYAEGNSPNIEEKFMEDFNKWFEQFKK